MSGIDAAIGSRLRALRHARALTLDQVAAHVGVRAQQVQKYETGQNRIAAGRLVRFARLFKVPLSAFFENVDLVESGAPFQAEPADGRGLLLAQEFDKLTEAQKRAVLSLVQSLSGSSNDTGRPYGT